MWFIRVFFSMAHPSSRVGNDGHPEKGCLMSDLSALEYGIAGAGEEFK